MFTELKEKAVQYIEVKVGLMKIALIGRTASLLSSTLYIIIVVFFFFFLTLFAGIGLAEVLSDAGISRGVAFFITTGAFAFLLVILIAFQKRITRFFANIFIRVLTEEDDSEKEKE